MAKKTKPSAPYIPPMIHISFKQYESELYVMYNPHDHIMTFPKSDIKEIRMYSKPIEGAYGQKGIFYKGEVDIECEGHETTIKFTDIIKITP